MPKTAPASTPTSRRKWIAEHRNYLLLAGTVFCLGGAFGVQLPLFANFIFERFSIRTNEYGYLEALRETPGFLTAFGSALVMLMAAPRLAALALIVMGMGIASYAWVVPIANVLGGSAILALIVTSVFWSLGFHMWSPLRSTLGLQFSPAGEKGRWLGWLSTISGIGRLMMMGLALVLVQFIEYEGMFLFAGGLLILGAILIGLAKSTTAPGDVEPEKPRRFLLKRRYAVFYLLSFLQGARKQIFIMFAVWLLVKAHGVQRETILILMLVNQVLLLLLAPTMGRLVDRYGERLMLSLSYIALATVFTGYALVTRAHALYGLYIVDNLIFVGGIALPTYLHKIAPEEDVRPTLTMGVTMNHIPSVLVPLIGGIVWVAFGYQIVFLAGALFALVSLVATQWVRPDEQAAPELAVEAAD